MMDSIHIPKLFVLDIVLQRTSLSSTKLVQRVFDAICQLKDVSLRFTKHLEDQISRFVTQMHATLKSKRGKAKQERLKLKYSAETWPRKVLFSEYEIAHIRAQNTDILLENLKLRTSVSKMKEKYIEIKKKYKTKKEKHRQKSKLLKKVSLQVLRKAKEMKGPKPLDQCSRF